ncbi:MAG: hypothetical protein FWC36_01700 [Spirochaetes bacterium]|nr:hypothetical protein [Spirochaetota bacterium]
MVQEELSAMLIKDSPALPIGYNPLEHIRRGLFHWVAVPFNGVSVWCELRTLNATQVRSCGDFSNIIPKETSEFTMQQLIEVRNYQEKLIRLTMNRPTYDEIFKEILNVDFVAQDKRKELEELKKTDLTNLTVKERIEFEDRLAETELFLGFILPEDTFGFLTAWINGNDISDIRKLTDDQFLEAAILAENGHDNPTDHLTGIFTDHNKSDIDRYAWHCLAEYREKKEIEKNAKSASRGRIIGGPKHG